MLLLHTRFASNRVDGSPTVGGVLNTVTQAPANDQLVGDQTGGSTTGPSLNAA